MRTGWSWEALPSVCPSAPRAQSRAGAREAVPVARGDGVGDERKCKEDRPEDGLRASMGAVSQRTWEGWETQPSPGQGAETQPGCHKGAAPEGTPTVGPVNLSGSTVNRMERTSAAVARVHPGSHGACVCQQSSAAPLGTGWSRARQPPRTQHLPSLKWAGRRGCSGGPLCAGHYLGCWAMTLNKTGEIPRPAGTTF